MCLRNQWVTFPIQRTKLNKLNSDINNIFILLYVELFIFHYLNHLIDLWSKESDSSYNGRCNHNNPLQYSCLENPRDRGAWWAAVYGVAESDTTEATEQQHSSNHNKRSCYDRKSRQVDEEGTKDPRNRTRVSCIAGRFLTNRATYCLAASNLWAFISCLLCMYFWRRAWLPIPVSLPGESHGQRSLAGYSP